VIGHYIRRTAPPDGYIQIRNGPKVLLSEHPHDTITVFVVFVKKDYGTVEPNATVVDVGANIGVFSLYAAHAGARSIIAIEPSAEGHAVLERNISGNRLEGTVEADRRAVSDVGGHSVSIPKTASPYNESRRRDASPEEDLVSTISLSGIMESVGGDVDLLKCDCEGAEYPFLMGATAMDLSRIKRIRMEYHAGPLDELTEVLVGHGFRETHRDLDGAILWLDVPP